MAKSGPEAKLIEKMKEDATAEYGGDLVWIKYHGNRYSTSGVSDLLLCLRGVFVAAEIKSPKNYGGSIERACEEGPTVKQYEFIKKVNKAGGEADVVASREQFMALLARAAARTK